MNAIKLVSFSCVLLLAGCAGSSSDDEVDLSSDEVKKANLPLPSYVTTIIPLADTDPALGRGALEERFEKSDGLVAVTKADLPQSINLQGKAFLEGLEKRAAASKAFSPYGPKVYRADFEGRRYFQIDYAEMRPGQGGSGWATRVVVGESGQVMDVGTQQLGSAQPIGDYRWRSPLLTGPKGVRVSVCSFEPDSWDVKVYINDETLRDAVGHHDGYERIRIVTHDPFSNSDHPSMSMYDEAGSTPGKADLFVHTIGEYSQAVYGNNAIPLKVEVKTSAGTLNVDVGMLPARLAPGQMEPSCKVVQP